MTPPPDPCLRFRLDGKPFGLPLSEVGEIAPVLRVHPVPMAPRLALGLLNLRGQVITLVDLSAVLGSPPAQGAAGQAELALVLAPPRHNLALRVFAPVEIGEAREEGVEILSASDLAARVDQGLEAAFIRNAAAGAES